MVDRVASGRQVFVSHASCDAAAGLAVVAALESAGIRCWIAPRDVRVGEPFADEIMRGIRECPVFLVVHTAGADASAHVMREVTQAATSNRRLLTVRVGTFTGSEGMRYYLDPVQAVVCDSLDDGRTLPTLVARVERLLGGDESVAAPATQGGAAGTPAWSGSRRTPAWRVLAAVAVVAAVIAVFAMADKAVRRPSSRPEPSGAGLPPAPPDSFPDPQASFPGLPARAAVAGYTPALRPAAATLEYVNRSGTSLKLVLLDCHRYFSGDKVGAWAKFPLPADDTPRYCNNFLVGKGWFAFSVVDPSGRYHYLGDAQVFERPRTRVVVRREGETFRWQVEQAD